MSLASKAKQKTMAVMSTMLDAPPASPDRSVGCVAAASSLASSASLDGSPPKRRMLRIRGIGNISYPSLQKPPSTQSLQESPKLQPTGTSPVRRLRILGVAPSKEAPREAAEHRDIESKLGRAGREHRDIESKLGRAGREPQLQKKSRLPARPSASDFDDNGSESAWDSCQTPTDVEDASDYCEDLGPSSCSESSWGSPKTRGQMRSLRRMRKTGSSVLDEFIRRRPKQVHSRKRKFRPKRKEKSERRGGALPDGEDMQESSDDLSGEEDVDIDTGFDGELSDTSAGEEGDDDSLYAKAWLAIESGLRQGEVGFNSYVMGRAGSAGLPKESPVQLDGSAEVCPPLQYHQEMVVFLLHPRSPVKRLLVDQPTGSGKTREMISALDGVFHDRRPKVPVFPRATVCRNFYEELLRWPSKYRDFFCCLHPSWGGLLSGLGPDGDWQTKRSERWTLIGLSSAQLRAATLDLREILEMKHTLIGGRFVRGFRAAFRSKHPNVPLPGAPLRALTFASAGGSHSMIGDDGKPMSALLKVAYPGDGCAYSQKIVLLDEAHNLIRTQTKYGRQLERLRQLLFDAEGSLIVGFTGTPVGDEPTSGRDLLNTFKGRSGAGLSDEGFITSLTQKMPPLFPRISPPGVPDVALNHFVKAHVCRRISLSSETLKSYDMKLAAGTEMKKLRGYCNMSSFCSTFHGNRRVEMLRRPHQSMPKLAAIATAICRRREKAVVLISRQGGYRAMLALLSMVAQTAAPPFCVASGDQLAEFNDPSNSHGQQILALVADAAQFGEGTSFFSVRRLYLADVPTSATTFQQQCGRVSRMFGHHQLPADERSVSIVLALAGTPPWMQDALAAWAFRALCRKGADAQEVVSVARNVAQKMRQAGIDDIGALKDRVDRVGGNPTSVAGLFHSWGIRDTDSSKQRPFGGTPQRKNQARNRSKEDAGSGMMKHLVKAAETLHSASCVDDVIARLSTKTVDDIAIEELSQQLAAQIPVLRELRLGAISCDVGNCKPDIAKAVEESLGECVSDWESTLISAQEYSSRGPRFAVDDLGLDAIQGLFGPWSAPGNQMGDAILVGHPALKQASAGPKKELLETPRPPVKCIRETDSIRAPVGNSSAINSRPTSLLKRTSLSTGQRALRTEQSLHSVSRLASSWDSLTQEVVDKGD